jgi:hypothetical protein
MNFQVRTGNERVLGYAVDDTVSMGKRLIPDV